MLMSVRKMGVEISIDNTEFAQRLSEKKACCMSKQHIYIVNYLSVIDI